MIIQVRKSILRENEEQAVRNAETFRDHRILAVNIMASPGAGKTTTILRLCELLKSTGTVGVIEGDVASDIDAEKVRQQGIPVVQLNTDGGCHLDAEMIAAGENQLQLRGPGFLFIENIGNLVCPAEFDLGEALRVVICSIPEGDDKPVKYPGIFAGADAVILNKLDLLPYVPFDQTLFWSRLRTVNEETQAFSASSLKNEGMEPLAEWLAGRLKEMLDAGPGS